MLYNGALFDNRKMNPNKILQYGFIESGDYYIYRAGLMNDTFVLTVKISKDGQIDTIITDRDSKEEYVLFRVQEAAGEFVGRVREAHKEVLEDIAENCFVKEIFRSDYAKKVIEYVKDKYCAEPEYLWAKSPNNAIFREQCSSKWYAALLTLPKRKIGIKEDGDIEIIDLKSTPEAIQSLVDGVNYLPGYHMNKKHWFTIRLDGSVPVQQIFRRIDISYDTVKKLI